MRYYRKAIFNNIIILFIMTGCIIVFLIIFCILFNNIQNNKISESKVFTEEEKSIYFPENGQVLLYIREKGITVKLDLEDYITGVVASEMPANFDEQAIKAQAVAARTFYINRRNNPCREAGKHNAEICNTVDCQVYMSKEERISKWNNKDAESNWNKIKNAVMETKGEILTYDGKVLEYPQYFAISHGKTEDAQDVMNVSVPYLKCVDSIGEEAAPKFKSVVKKNINEFVNIINANYPKEQITVENLKDKVYIEKYNKSGSVNVIKMGQNSIKGTEFRKLFNLNSAYFTIDMRDDIVSITCTGYGHGLGMSQWGANYMAKNNYSYQEILKHYYTGVEITKLKYN